MKSMADNYKLRNGYEIPCMAYGTWKVPDGEVVTECVKEAIKLGYRHIDTAAIYKNETGVGEGIANSGIPRKELFITTKLWNSERGYDKVLKAFDESMQKLNLEYLDLYLLHWPAAKHQFDNWEAINLDSWKAMMELYKSGKVKAIGVSNFLSHHLKALMQTEIPPMVDQIEFHPGYMQAETVQYCKDNHILVEAWSPLGGGRVLESPTLVEIAQKYGKTTAQICVKWCLQHGTLPLPKSVNLDRIRSNAEIFDFVISDEDMTKIDQMPETGASGSHPDSVSF